MESLYRLENHVIVYEKEDGFITFFKDINVDAIFFENDSKESFEFFFENKIYTNKDFKINKIDFDENGKYTVAEYISKNTKFTIKEIFRYVSKNLVERYYIFYSRYEGDLKYFKMISNEIKSKEKIKVLLPLSSDFILEENNNYTQKSIPDKEPGILLFTTEKESLLTWYYNETNFADMEFENNKITYIVNCNEKIKPKQDITIGGQYYMFYEGSYIESVETLQKFYRGVKEIKNIDNDFDWKKEYGPLYYKKKGFYYNKSFSKLIENLYYNKINTEDVIEWLEIENAAIPFNQRNLQYGTRTGSEDLYPLDFFENVNLFSYILGNCYIYKKNEKKFKEYDEILDKSLIKNGKIYPKYIKTNNKNIIGFIKKYENSFYICLFNMKPFSEKTEINISENFSEDYIKLKYYKIINKINGKIEAITRNVNKINMNFEPYEAKILSFEFNDLKKAEGTYFKLNKLNDFVTYENNFYKIFFNNKIPLLQSLETNSIIINKMDSNLFLKKDKYEFEIKNENEIQYKSENVEINYKVSNNNIVKININFFTKKKNNYINFCIKNVKYFMNNNKIVSNENKTAIKESVSIVGENLVFINNFKTDVENCDMSIENKNIKINFLTNENKKYNFDFEISVL